MIDPKDNRPKRPESIFTRGYNPCQHNKFIIDEKLDRVKCAICGEWLNPMWVLTQMCNREARANQQIHELNRIAKKADAKNRCKCEHCGRITRIQK